MRVFVLASLLACDVGGAFESAGRGVKQFTGTLGGYLAEYTVCALDVINCGHVFQCSARADTPSNHVELCIDDEDTDQLAQIEELYGTCEPTPRHQGLCRYICPGEHGCNAFSGCWCSAESP